MATSSSRPPRLIYDILKTLQQTEYTKIVCIFALDKDRTMITVTDKAKTRIAEIMKDEHYDSSYFVRVAVESGGCSGLSYKLNFDNEEKKGDQFFEDKGVRICLDIKSFLYLAGTELDYSDGLTGKGFEFHNPNASRTCACGESFSV